MKCGICKKEGKDVAHIRQCSKSFYDDVVDPSADARGYSDQEKQRMHVENIGPLFSDGPDPESVAATDFQNENEFDALANAFPKNESFLLGKDRKQEPEVNHTVNRAPGRKRAADVAESDRAYLQVPFREKDEAKKHGAFWDPDRKSWFVDATNTDDWEPLMKWIPLEDGIYRFDHEDVDTRYYMVYHTVHGANQQVAKMLVLSEEEQLKLNKVLLEGKLLDGDTDQHLGAWEYVGKAPIQFLTGQHRLSDEEAAKFGQVYGWCGRCGRTLTNEESKKIGIGPVCRAR